MAPRVPRSVDPNILGGLQGRRSIADKIVYLNEHLAEPIAAIADTRFPVLKALVRYVIAIAIDVQLNSPGRR